MGTPVVLSWPLDLYILYLICRYKLGSPGFRGGSTEISAEVLVKFSRGRTHPGYGPVKKGLVEEVFGPEGGQE